MRGTETLRAGRKSTLGRLLLFYALGTLLVLQFMHLAITYLLLPQWIGRFGFVLAVLGLPFVLIGWLVRGKPKGST